jgi:hypothetical protein
VSGCKSFDMREIPTKSHYPLDVDLPWGYREPYISSQIYKLLLATFLLDGEAQVQEFQ